LKLHFKRRLSSVLVGRCNMISSTKQLVPVVSAQCQQQRGMANLKAISMRLKSVKNIQKITSSMKMVSAAKYSRAERELRSARPLGEGAMAFYEKAEVKAPEDGTKELIVCMTSDRGLCGGVHSGIGKYVRNELNERIAAGQNIDNVKILCVGDKNRAFMSRIFGTNIMGVGSEIGRLPPSFIDASKIANHIIDSGYEYDNGRMIYNKYRSVVSYVCSEIPLYRADAVNAAEKISVYDSLDADVVQSYLEFSTASLFYYALKEGATSEQSARMTAMENSTKNAGEMIDKLTIMFNRTRQAVITGELIEIISGAAAL